MSSGSVVAVITGGDRAVSTASNEIEVSASASYDENIPESSGSAAGLTFAWNCSAITSETQASCDDLSSILAAASEILSFPGSALAEGTYTFGVTVSAIDGRMSTASVELSAAGVTRPDVSLIGPIGGLTTTSTKTTIEAKVAIPSNGEETGELESTWSLVSGTLPVSLDEAASTPLTMTRIATRAEGIVHHDLVIQSGMLIPGSEYTFRLEAQYSESNSDLGFASLTIFTARLPSSGSIQVLPTSGMALVTKFELTALNWAADALPIRYRFSVLNAEGSLSTLRKATIVPVLGGVTLEAGEVTVIVTAIDNFGSEAQAERKINVEPLDLSSEEEDELTITSVTDELLAEAFAFNAVEQVCQVIVAASSTLSSSDESPRLVAELVSALAESRTIEDTDSESIEQSTAALRAPIVEATSIGALTVDSAASALDLAASFGRDVVLVGLGSDDATTTEDLVTVLSSLLESELFDSSESLSEADQTKSSNATETLLQTLDNLAIARIDLAVVDEAATGVCSNSICSAVQRISDDQLANSQIAIDGMDAFAVVTEATDIQGADDEFEIYLYEFNRNPRATEASASVDTSVVRFKLIAVVIEENQRRQLEESLTQRVELAIPLKEGQRGGSRSVVTEELRLECDWGYTGTETVTCSNDETVVLDCDGARVDYIVECGETITTVCVGFDEDLGIWSQSIGNCVAATSTTTHVTCACDVDATAETPTNRLYYY